MSYLLYSTGTPLSNARTGGLKRFVELAKYINEHNSDVTFCSMDSPTIIKRHGFNKFITLNGLSEKSIFRFLFPELRILFNNFRIVWKLKCNNYSKVIVFDVPTAIGLCLLGFRNICLLIRKDLIGYEYVSRNRKSIIFYIKLFFQWVCEMICIVKSKIIIAQCYYDIDVLYKRHPLLKERIISKSRIQINNINPSWITKNQYVDSEISLSVGKFRICFIGDFNNNRKGHGILLPVAKNIVEKFQYIEFEIIGDGGELQYYKDIYCSEKIHFWGRLDDPMSILRQCQLLVVPSLADSCPNTVMEALYHKIAVVGSRKGGIPEILNFDEALFDLSESSLYHKIETLIMCPNYLRSLKDKELTRREELCFNWSEKIQTIICE